MDDALFDAAEKLLAERMHSVDDLLAELRRGGHHVNPADANDREAFIFGMTERGYWHFGDSLARPEHLLPARVFTHVVTTNEADRGYLPIDPDLTPLTMDDARVFETADVAFDDDFEPDLGAILRSRDDQLPWPSGTTVAVRWIESGRLAIERIADDLQPDESIIDGYRGAVEASLAGDGTAMLLNAIAALLADQPDSFKTPQSPIGELLVAAGFDRHDDEIAPHGFDWDALAERRQADRVAAIAREYGLSEDQAQRFQRIQSAVYRAASPADDLDYDDDDVAAAVREIIDALGDDSRLNGLFLSWLNGLAYRLPGVVDRGAFVDAALATGRRLPPAVHVLRATRAERAGDAVGHEAAIRDALRADPHFAPALEDAQWIAAERGEASRALTLLHELGAPASREEVEMLGWYASPGPMAAKRNDPCPCGSGRKYKQCCSRHNGHALDDRFTWRLLRAAEFAQRPAQRDRLLDVVRGAFGADDAIDDELPPALLFVGTQHPALWWLSLAEGGGLERYLAERGSLFPDDERDLVRSWLPARHRLLRFDEAGDEDQPKDPRALVSLVDLVTGERLDVPALQGADRPRRGHVALMLVLSDGTRPRLAGLPIDVASDEIEATTALLSTDSPDAAALARLLLHDEFRELAAGIEERYGDLDLDEFDPFDDLDDDYLDRLDLVLALLDDDVDEDGILGRDPWEDDEPLSDDELFALMAAAHSEYEAAIESGEEIDVAGEAMSPRLHVAMHTIAARQILDGIPPEAYPTALRLLDEGYELHDVMHMLSRVVSDHAYAAIKEGKAPDDDEYAAALRSLPGDWEHERHRIHAQERARSRQRDHHRRHR